MEEELLTTRDLKISGHVTWVGHSSAETSIHLHQRTPTGGWQRIIEAQFVMVAVAPGTKAYFNPLDIQTPEQQAEFDQGQERNFLRRLKSQVEKCWKLTPFFLTSFSNMGRFY